MNKTIFFSFSLLFIVIMTVSLYASTPKNDLDKSVRYIELTENKDKIFLSGDNQNDIGITYVPELAEVDINSIIEIELIKSKLPLSSNVQDYQQDIQTSNKKIEELRNVLRIINNTINTRILAIQAYNDIKDIPIDKLEGSKEYEKFDKAVKEFAKQELALTTAPLWDTFNAESFDYAFADPTYRDLGNILQQEIIKEEQKLQTLINSVQKNSAHLRIEAFLEKQKGFPIPIHIPGYDNIEQRKLEYKPKDVLFMDSGSRKEFEKELNEISRIAKETEQIRTGEVRLNELISKTYSSEIKSIENISKEISPIPDDLTKTLESLKKDINNLIENSDKVITEATDEEKEFWKSYRDNLNEIIKININAEEIKDITGSIAKARKDWEEVKPESFISLIENTKDIYRKVQKFSTSDSVLIVDKDKIDKMVLLIQKRPEILTQETWGKIKRINSDRLISISEKINNQIISINTSFNKISKLLEFTKISPMTTNINSSQSIEVSLIDAPNTKIELQRVDRSVNDHISINLSLITSSGEITSEATFLVKQFGWHSILAANIVLAKQSEFIADNSFKFAPAVAWLEKYYPRRTDNELYDKFARFFNAGIGMHVAFLDQNPNKESEIGIGFALSFWQDRIVAGMGYNLMNDSKPYYYIGSNLIPLLHSMGYGLEGSAGKQP